MIEWLAWPPHENQNGSALYRESSVDFTIKRSFLTTDFGTQLASARHGFIPELVS